jgi:hypothetical protein
MNSKYMAIPVTPEMRDGQQTASYPVDDAVMQVGKGAAMTVGQVIELVKAWVDLQAKHAPGFLGAHLMGGITSMASGETFPTYRDVDLHLIFRDDIEMPGENLEALYEGLMIEAGFRQQKDYRSPEVVLADPVIASHMAVPSIVCDPTGWLSRLQEAVAEEYAQRRWVQARCEAEKRQAFGWLERTASLPEPITALNILGYTCTYVSGVLALASLQPITGRRGLVQMRRILERWGRLDLHQRLLAVIGVEHLSREQVECALRDATEVFDIAVRVKRTPHPFGHKMYAHLRPYLVEGTQEMISEGYHREAAGWVMAYYASSIQIIQTDAPSELTPDRQEKFEEYLRQFVPDGEGSVYRPERSGAEAWRVRIERARAIFREVFTLADEIIASREDHTLLDQFENHGTA